MNLMKSGPTIKPLLLFWPKGPFKCYVTQMGVGGVSDFLEKSVTEV